MWFCFNENYFIPCFFFFRGFQENPNGKYELRYKAPRIDLAGPYVISGKILILPIQGEGQSNISIGEPMFIITLEIPKNLLEKKCLNSSGSGSYA